jgi:transcriptional regulator with XRE-family HTH domain
MNLGCTIKKCRKLRGLTQEQLADVLGLSMAHISLLEKNKREPSISVIESIAKALEIPLSVLIFLASENGDIKELKSKYRKILSKDIMDLIKNAEE